MVSKRPYFIWDYDLTEDDVRKLLASGTETEKIWIMSRILESARYDDIWKYVTYEQVKTWFPKLRLKKPIRQAWERALYVWG